MPGCFQQTNLKSTCPSNNDVATATAAAAAAAASCSTAASGAPATRAPAGVAAPAVSIRGGGGGGAARVRGPVRGRGQEAREARVPGPRQDVRRPRGLCRLRPPGDP